MPTFTEDENTAKYQVRAYQPGMITINDKIFTTSVIISAEQLITDWRPQTLTELEFADFEIIRQLKPDILLIGTGGTLTFPTIETYGELINHGIGIEIMDTGAACRTYNALTAENRSVIAALLIR